jgi:hypothetical protein
MRRLLAALIIPLAAVLVAFVPHPASSDSSLTMLDSAFAPSQAQVRSTGAQVWAGYLPSPEVYHAWSYTDFATVHAVVPVLPIYVPHQYLVDDATCSAEGHDAVDRARAARLQLTISIDIEAGSYYANPLGTTRCVVVWTAAVRADGGRGVPYAPLGLLRRLNTGDVDGEWLAYWTNRPMDPEGGPLELYRWTGMRATQWMGGHSVAGVNVDTSSVDPGIVGLAAPRNTGGVRLTVPIVGAVAVPRLSGAAWEVAGDGGVFTLGGAPFYGSMGGRHLSAPVVAIAPTPDGLGYWLVGSDGGVFCFGNAPFYGSAAGVRLNKPVVAIIASSTGRGYALIAGDGGSFNFGDLVVGSLVP